MIILGCFGGTPILGNLHLSSYCTHLEASTVYCVPDRVEYDHPVLCFRDNFQRRSGRSYAWSFAAKLPAISRPGSFQGTRPRPRWRRGGVGLPWFPSQPLNYLEDHPMTCKWLITMVIVSPLSRDSFPFQMG